ncbi:hypothetical protein AALP_AA8G022800 [Arabis alpina]|uniref:CCHC-type domain-containing protein n=1 Tax=Arabis alpina TaxID=50452 RepID=A0A087G4H1_ARAAL|nr:hypothetical protein AALP_AA8G022800 [Arabis alpina]
MDQINSSPPQPPPSPSPTLPPLSAPVAITLVASSPPVAHGEDVAARNLVIERTDLPPSSHKKIGDKDRETNHAHIQFPPLKGVWVKKLDSLASVSHPPPRTSVINSRNSPLSVSEPLNSQHARHQQAPRTVAVEDDIRFPGTAKMNPASRNLYRATEPEYLDDGTPKVTISRHVLLQGLENQKEYVLGQFYRCYLPPGGLIYAVFNKLWGRSCKITIRKLGESNYLFHIPDESTRTWVLQRGLWHVDDCLMFVAPWTPEASLAIPEIRTIPVWVTLKKIPNILYSIPGISHIASGLGAPMATHKPRLDPILMGEAKILVEVELCKAVPSRIAADDENGFISMVDVEYAWLPSKCERCGQLGHKVKRCLQVDSESHVANGGIEIGSNVSIKVVPKSANSNSTLVVASGIEESPPTILVDENATPNSIVATSAIISAGDLISLATISVLENIYESPTMVTINDTIDSPILEFAQPLPVTTTTSAQSHSTVQEDNSASLELDFGSNKFASLIALEEEEDLSDLETDSMELMTPSGKRILRDRPVKPSTKAKEMIWQSVGRGHGNRGRGNRGGCG